MEGLFRLAAGCVLDRVEARFAPTPEGWIEASEIEVRATSGTCDWVELRLPPGVGLGAHGGRERRSDDTKVALDPVRWERSPQAVDGSARVCVHLQDLLKGDRVELVFERLWPPGPVDYEAGAEVEVEAPGRLEGGSRVVDERPAPARPAAGPPGDVVVEERLVLEVPPGDPQVRLYPGGGSRATLERLLVFGDEERLRAWPLDVPPGTEARLSAEPNGAAELWQDAGGTRVIVFPSEGAARVRVAWEVPDAPTYGERAPDVARLTVDAPGGEVRWEGTAWTLAGVNGRIVLPSRDVLARALDARFKALAIPEPGAPMELRGKEPSWELAAALRPILWDRAPVAPLPQDPVWPRKLVKARKSGVVSPTEGALILWLYARQVRLEADWALVRPASAGPGAATSPAGFTAPLVRVRLDGEERWIDPTCGACAPFELPPDLEGADALGPGVARTSEPTPGRHEVTLTADRVEWRLEGPPALLLRRWLAELDADDLQAALAGRVGGPGARLVEVEGTDVPGAPIHVVASRGAGALVDPIALPVPHPERGAWVEWVGERVVVRPAGDEPPVRYEAIPLTFERTVVEGVVRERLVVTDRSVPADLVHALDAVRAAPPPAPEPSDPAPPAP